MQDTLCHFARKPAQGVEPGRQRDAGSCPGNSICYPHGRQFGRKWRVIHPNGGREPRFKAVWATVRAGIEENSPERWNDSTKQAAQAYSPSAQPCYRYLPNGLHYRNLQPGSDREFYLTFVKNQIKFLAIMCPTALYNADFHLYPRTFSLRG